MCTEENYLTRLTLCCSMCSFHLMWRYYEQCSEWSCSLYTECWAFCGLLCVYMFWLTFSSFYLLSFLLQFLLSWHHHCAAALLSSLSASLSVAIRILVTVVTWLWWLDPGLKAAHDEFWLKTDRPWTYCMWPCRLHIYTPRVAWMNTHIHTNTGLSHLEWKVCKLSKLSLLVFF